MSFRQVGQDISGAIDFYQEAQERDKKKNAIREFVTRQLARLPPEKQAEAQALLAVPEGDPAGMPAPSPMPASTMMDGTPDAPIPPEISGMQPGAAPVDDLFAPPPPDLDAMAQPKPDPGTESLRMLLEATRDDVMEPKGLFDYIAGMGKQDMVGSGRMDLENFKSNVRRDIQQTDLQARLDRLERVLETREGIADKQIGSREGIADKNIGSRERIAGQTNATRTNIAEKGNETRKVIAANKPAGKGGKDPDAMTQEEIDAELGVYQQRADSLSTAGGDPKAIGYKPAEEKFATIDEGARQKDLSKSLDRVTALKAAKARKLAGGGGSAAPGTAAPGAGKVYTSKADIKADLAAGTLQPGSKVQFQMPDGSTVLVNTGK